MANKPEITDPRTLDLRSVQALAQQCRQRLAAVDQVAAAAAAAIRSSSSSSNDITNLNNAVGTLNQQLRALTDVVDGLSTASGSTVTQLIFIEVDGNDGEDGFFQV